MTLTSSLLPFRAGMALALAIVAGCLSATAEIAYDAALGAYRVWDFPAEYPCTLERLVEMDRLLGLGKVMRDPATDVTTVGCRLLIGRNDRTNTYFQVGSAEHPRETLIMRGDLYVCPWHIAAENRFEPRVNRLTLGVENDPSIRTALKFDAPALDRRLSLVTGERPAPTGPNTIGRGGQLLAWNSTITALKQEPGYEIAELRLRGDGFVLVNSTLSWVKGMMTYGIEAAALRTRYEVADSVFEHGGSAVVGGKLEMRNCRFANCETAVLDRGSLNVGLRNCAFENNRQNWMLRFPGKEAPRLLCVDCDIREPSAGNLMELQESTWTRQMRDSGVALRSPRFLSQRHIVVQVLDAAGKTVAGAEIKVKADQADADLDEGLHYRTDAAGRTPGEGSADAVLLTERCEVVPEKGATPAVTHFTYTITASTNGRTATAAGLRPDTSWKRVTLTLP